MDNSPSDLQLIENSAHGQFVLARDFKDGEIVPPHKHSRAQLLHTLTGVMLVDTPMRAWAVPPGRGLWIPPGVRHNFTMRGHVAVRTLYVKATDTGTLPNEPVIVAITPLVRELIVRALELVDSTVERNRYSMIVSLLMSELHSAQRHDLSIPWPRSPSLKKFADRLRTKPNERRGMTEIANEHGLSLKTLTRRFLNETGLTPDAWRRHARMLAAVAELQSGKSVTQVAQHLGFESTSSFTAAFRRTYGMTPRKAARNH